MAWFRRQASIANLVLGTVRRIPLIVVTANLHPSTRISTSWSLSNRPRRSQATLASGNFSVVTGLTPRPDGHKKVRERLAGMDIMDMYAMGSRHHERSPSWEVNMDDCKGVLGRWLSI